MSNTRLKSATIAALALGLLGPTVALAQPGAPPPPPPPTGAGPGPGYYAEEEPGFFMRYGFTIGFSLGVGGMSSDSGIIESCDNCDYQPAAVGFDAYLGGMVNPRLAIMGEVWAMGQAVESSGRTTLMQTMLLATAKYWITQQLWIKGGLGIANLSYSYDTGYDTVSDDIDAGGAIMGAIGYELLSNPRFALDLQLKGGAGTYDGIGEQVSTGLVNLGFTWF